MRSRHCGTRQIMRYLCFVVAVIISIVLAADNPPIVEKAIKENGGASVSDLASLYKVSRTWYENTSTRSDAIQLFHHLADSHGHVLSMAKLGHYYTTEKGTNPQLALHYFMQAGENGPHHASLYNAGRLMAEQSDWVGALAYLRAAATLGETHPPEYITEATTQSALQAYEIVSEQIAREELTVKQVADVFIYGSLQDLPEKEVTIWSQAVMALVQFNQTFVETSGQTQDSDAMNQAAEALRVLWETYGKSGKLSKLQTYLLLDNMNDMLGPLAGLDDAYVPMAAGYAEALATLSQYCYDQYATEEDEPACFNGAAASAMSYYRRANDGESAKRVLQFAQGHPNAATHWRLMEQTPRVFHPELTSRAWWTASDFSAAQSLQAVYKKSKKTIQAELQAVKDLQEGRLRGTNQQQSSGLPQTVEVNANGDTETTAKDDGTGGFQRIFTPYIGVRTDDTETSKTGAGGWAEFGPLFDGMTWNEQNCDVVPTICNALKNDQSLCTARASPTSSSDVWKLCGADTVVTILRLRPGTNILPHCGTTNSRLIMHFALEGADGVEFTVGGKMVKNYDKGDGNAIVFDDSFEHSVYHGGKKDRFVVLAVLAHPEVR